MYLMVQTFSAAVAPVNDEILNFAMSPVRRYLGFGAIFTLGEAENRELQLIA
jgi:hypothetical protein